MSMNNESMVDVSKMYCLDKMKAATHLTLALQYNPETFALYDNGDELKRITAVSPTPTAIPTTGLPSTPATTTAITTTSATKAAKQPQQL